MPMNPYLNATNCLVVLNCLVLFALVEIAPDVVDNMQLYFYQNPEFGAWQFVTHMFVHADITHLLFNMIALFMFGRILESIWGSTRFVVFYFTVGVGASLVYMLVQYFQFQFAYDTVIAQGASAEEFGRMLLESKYYPVIEESAVATQIFNVPAVGASGAIYGVLVAFALMFPNYKLMLIFLPIPIAAKIFVPVLLAIDVIGGFTGFSIFGRNIAHFAHLGGAVVGFAMMMLWRRMALERMRRMAQAAQQGQDPKSSL